RDVTTAGRVVEREALVTRSDPRRAGIERRGARESRALVRREGVLEELPHQRLHRRDRRTADRSVDERHRSVVPAIREVARTAIRRSEAVAVRLLPEAEPDRVGLQTGIRRVHEALLTGA